MNDSFEYEKINGYLNACAAICSLNEAPISYNFHFDLVGNSDDLDVEFKNYFINIWETDGVPCCYKNYEELVKTFKLHFKSLFCWREVLSGVLYSWLTPLSIRDIVYIRNEIMLYLDTFLMEKSYEVLTFGNEDNEFIRNNLEYLKNDDYIFKTDKGIYLLHLGMTD